MKGPEHLFAENYIHKISLHRISANAVCKRRNSLKFLKTTKFSIHWKWPNYHFQVWNIQPQNGHCQYQETNKQVFSIYVTGDTLLGKKKGPVKFALPFIQSKSTLLTLVSFTSLLTLTGCCFLCFFPTKPTTLGQATHSPTLNHWKGWSKSMLGWLVLSLAPTCPCSCLNGHISYLDCVTASVCKQVMKAKLNETATEHFIYKATNIWI